MYSDQYYPDDIFDFRGRQDQLIDIRHCGQDMKLLIYSGSHIVKGSRQLFKLIVAANFHRLVKSLIGNMLDSLHDFFKRNQTPTDLMNTQEHHDSNRQRDDKRKNIFKIGDWRQYTNS